MAHKYNIRIVKVWYYKHQARVRIYTHIFQTLYHRQLETRKRLIIDGIIITILTTQSL